MYHKEMAEFAKKMYGRPQLAIQIGQQGRGRRSRRSHAKKPDAHHEILDRA